MNKRTLKQKLICCILLALVISVISACGSTDNSNTSNASENNEKNITISQLQECMLQADTTLPEMVTVSSLEEQAELNFSYLSDLSYDLVDEYFYAHAKDGTAEEIAVIKLKDQGDAAAMMDSLHDHIAQRQGTFQEYAPEQVEMTEHAVVTRENAYAALIISSKSGLVQKAFQSCFE